MRALVNLLVHVVRDEQVNAQVTLLKSAKNGEHGGKRGGVEPVVGIDDLVVRTLGFAQAGTHSHAMAAVLLMHHADNARIPRLPFICLGARFVLRAVIDDDDLDVGRELGSLED